MKKVFFAILFIGIAFIYAEKPDDWNEPAHIKAILTAEGDRAGLPIGLSHCVAYHESRFNPLARSKLVGNYRSCGLMQLYRKYIVFLVKKHSSHPESFDWRNPLDNAEVGCGYLAYLIHKFGDSVYLGVLAYNWGETNVSSMKSLDEVPKHCKKYADSVLKMLDEYEETW